MKSVIEPLEKSHNSTNGATTAYVQSNLSQASAVTIGAGSGVTSAVCATGVTCNSLAGTVTVTGGTATTGTIFTLAWTATSTAYRCIATMNGGSTFLGIGHSAATTTGMNVTAAVAITGLTVNVDYECRK